jgi:hypothetical protein
MNENDDKKLLGEFIATFAKLDDLSSCHALDPIAFELSIGDFDEYGFKQWHPIPYLTDRSHLDAIYKDLPAQFPPLYEHLVLSYRWAEVDLASYRLLPNPPGPDLSRFLKQILNHKELYEVLTPSGYLQFGKGADVNYDPVCFDLKHRLKDGDCRIVRLDHEEILCNYRVREVEELAPSFRKLVIRTISQQS